MLDLAPEKLMPEIRAAQAFLKPFLEKRSQIIRMMATRHYRGDAGSKLPVPENYPYTYKSFCKPSLCFGVPTCKVMPIASIQDKAVADAIELAVNAWSKETSWKKTLNKVMDDLFAGFAVTKAGLEPRGDYASGGLPAVEGDFEQRPNYPFCVRIDPMFFIIDPCATSLEDARFIGHSFERDLYDVQADQRYKPELTAKLGEQQREPMTDARPFPIQHGKDRKRITLFEIYVPEYSKILTIAETGSDGGLILRDEPFWGPDEGPYVLWGLDSIPGEVIPISPLQALWDQIEKVNEHAVDAADSARTHKKIIGYEPSAADDAKKVKKARNGDVVAMKNPAGVKDFEIGGVGKEQVEYTEMERQRTDRNLGFTDAQRGLANAEETATAAGIASASSDLRIDGMKDRVKDCVTDCYRKVSWYLFHDESIGPMDLVHTDPATGQQVSATFIPGVVNGAYVKNQWYDAPPQADFEDFNLTVDASTMQKQNDALEMKRAQDKFALIMAVAPIIPNTPWINWEEAINDVGKSMNDPFLADRVLNQPGLQMATMAGMMGQQGGQPGGATAGAPTGQPMPPTQGPPRTGPRMQSAPPRQKTSPATRPGLHRNARAGVAARVA